MEDTDVEEARMIVETRKDEGSHNEDAFCLQDVRMKNKIFVRLNVAGKQTRFLVDSGATCNVIGQKDVDPEIEILPTTSCLH